jgi:hypothetical protein
MKTRYFIMASIVFALVVTSAWLYATPKADYTAHTLEYARRAPIFGIAGTDPTAIRRVVNELDDTLQELSDIQTDNSQKELIESIYPLSFLRALADLEEARQQLLSSKTNADAEKYRKLAKKAIERRTEDATRFRKAVEEALPLVPKNARFPSFGGTLSAARMLEAAKQAEDVREYELQLACLNGDFNICKTLPEPLRNYPLVKNFEHSEIPLVVGEILALRGELQNDSGSDPRVLVSLEKSTCLASKSPPYYMTVNKERRREVRYVGDMFFASTAGSEGATMQHMHDKLGIEYAILNPMNYYTCPDVLTDMSAAYAIIGAADFARKNPQLAPTERERFLNDSALREQNAILYLRAALADQKLSENDTTHRTALEIVLMFEQRSAGLELLVNDIVSVTRNDLRLMRENIPFDLRADKLLLSHSAFPSLLLAHKGAMREILYEEHSVRDSNAFGPYALQYSDLRETVSREKLVSDLRAFLTMEGKLSEDVR